MSTINLLFSGIWNQVPRMAKAVIRTILIATIIGLALTFVGYLQHDGGMPLHTR